MSIDLKIPGYDLIEEIGAGGMAKVYLGIQTLLERKVAIKILHQRLSSESDEFKKRFFVEGKVLAKLQHDNIVSIIDIGEVDGMLYMAMEYVENGTLTDWLKKQEVTTDQAIQLCSKVGLALHSVHLKHIVHRDLKPSNILLRDINTPLLTDFGIARQTDEDQGLTQTGHILGTLQYMSPEQIRGMHVDHRSDIYALGLMFYRLLIGRLPFVANSQYDLSRMQCEDIPPPLPPPLADIQPVMDAMLAKDPADRFQTCLEFCKAVQNLSVTNDDYASELEGATRIYDPSELSTGGYGTGRHSGRYSERHSGQFSDRHSERTSGQFTGRTGSQTGGYEQTRMMTGDQGGQGQGKGKKLAILGGIAAVVLGIGSYFVFNAMSGPDVPVLSDGDTRKMTSILRRVNASIDDQELDSALGRLHDAREISPDHPEVLSTAEALAAQYELDAMDLLEEGQLEAALEATKKGLEAYPEFPALIAVQEDVSAQFTERENQRIIGEALQLATDYVSQGALIEPEGANAREEYARVIAIDEFNQAALAGMSSIESTLAAQIRTIVESGDFDAARQQLDTVLAFFQTSPVLNDMRQGIAEAQRAENEQQMITQFLADAEKSMNEDRLIEPESDSALYYYREVLNLNADSEDARLGLEKIAAKYLGDGNKALADGDFRLALQLAGYGLRAQQDNAELQTVQRTATSELGEVEQQIQNTLQRATRIVQAVRASTTTEIRTSDGNFENAGVALLEAKSGFEEVLTLQADNDDATRSLTTLSTVLYNDVVKLQRNGEIVPAKAALASASSITADEDRFATLSASLDEQIQQKDIAERSSDLVRQAESAIAVRPMTNESIDFAATAVANVRSEFPNNANLSKLVSDLAGAVAQEARAVSAQGSDAAGLLMVNQGLGHFAGNSILGSAKADIERARRQREEAERQRIAAISGQLAIDATPWGVITEIRDQDGTVVDLGSDTQTPFVKTLVEGSYTILIRSDSGVESTQQVTVVRQQLALARADFGLISADEYFERSAW